MDTIDLGCRRGIDPGAPPLNIRPLGNNSWHASYAVNRQLMLFSFLQFRHYCFYGFLSPANPATVLM
jgi:hypothetical protein